MKPQTPESRAGKLFDQSRSRHGVHAPLFGLQKQKFGVSNGSTVWGCQGVSWHPADIKLLGCRESMGTADTTCLRLSGRMQRTICGGSHANLGNPEIKPTEPRLQSHEEVFGLFCILRPCKRLRLVADCSLPTNRITPHFRFEVKPLPMLGAGKAMATKLFIQGRWLLLAHLCHDWPWPPMAPACIRAT